MFEINGQEVRNREPIGGWARFDQHRHDHTHKEIEALTIEIGYNGRYLPAVSGSEKKGTVKSIVRGLR